MEPKNNPNPKPVEGNPEKIQAGKPGTKNAADKNETPLWQNVLVGGVPGILIGAASMYAYDAFGAEPGAKSGLDVPLAHSVNDSMNFNQALAAARAELGPGGAFVWHGQVYGTYRIDDPEWLNMTPEERAEYSQYILSQVHPAPYTPTNHEPPIVAAGQEGPNPGQQPDPGQEGPNPGQQPDPGQEGPNPGQQPDPGHDGTHTYPVSEVHLDEVEQFETEDGNIVTVGFGTVDGHDAALADSDGDQLVDTLFVDENDDQMIDENEVFDVSDSGITPDDMIASVCDGNCGVGGDIPDYTNDAEVDGL